MLVEEVTVLRVQDGLELALAEADEVAESVLRLEDRPGSKL